MGTDCKGEAFWVHSTEAGVPLDRMGSGRGASSPESQGNWSCGKDPPMCLGEWGSLGWKVDAERIPYVCVWGGDVALGGRWLPADRRWFWSRSSAKTNCVLSLPAKVRGLRNFLVRHLVPIGQP